ncbi:MAG: hypothetical protein A2138_05565 [Deltaproteobacteria bacterium RBG_16_71_12]|nr:MAG: hypothetical protein A2138_05565 [Deltaproteobacteria bacterium RBG_16_71_12]
MAIPRRLIIIAASAAIAGAALYMQNRMRARKDAAAKKPAPTGAGEPPKADAPAGSSTAAPTTSAPAEAAAPGGAARELSLFLAGESWHDEIGWQGIWEREGIESPESWLKSKGKEVLAAERKKLAEHPALLAGCRRRWIVVCRYAGIDVTDAASTWNESEVPAVA